MPSLWPMVFTSTRSRQFYMQAFNPKSILNNPGSDNRFPPVLFDFVPNPESTRSNEYKQFVAVGSLSGAHGVGLVGRAHNLLQCCVQRRRILT
jgi:hypothetical protein